MHVLVLKFGILNFASKQSRVKYLVQIEADRDLEERGCPCPWNVVRTVEAGERGCVTVWVLGRLRFQEQASCKQSTGGYMHWLIIVPRNAHPSCVCAICLHRCYRPDTWLSGYPWSAKWSDASSAPGRAAASSISHASQRYNCGRWLTGWSGDGASHSRCRQTGRGRRGALLTE